MRADGAARTLRQRSLLAVMAACIGLLAAAAVVQADEPAPVFSFSGRAEIKGDPAPRGTSIAIEVNGKLIGRAAVVGGDGEWIVLVDADLLPEDVCAVVFLVDGQRAERVGDQCSVDVRLIVGGGAADGAERPLDQAETESSEALAEAEEAQDDSEPDGLSEAGPAVQPRTPGTGSGGLTRHGPDANWPAAAFAAGSAAVCVLFALLLVRRRSAWYGS